MKISTYVFLFTALICLPLSADVLYEVETPRGAKQKFLVKQPENAKAVVILFAGGKGALKLHETMFGGAGMYWGAKNFLVRSRAKFAEHGLIVVTVDAPSTHKGFSGMLGGFRSSKEHVEDIDAVISRVREIADLPIWLVGTSRGTESATNIAIASEQSPHGLVLTSSMTVGDHKGQAVTDFDLKAIEMPTLITHHEEDGCSKTRPEDVENIKRRLVNTPLVELRMYKGGQEQSHPCRAMSYHGYLGIEEQVVDDIAAFVLANS